MNKLQELVGSISKPQRSNVSNNKKRKWSEIEQLKEKFQLVRELKAFEDSLEYMLEDY